jgi:hypothetical protein
MLNYADMLFLARRTNRFQFVNELLAGCGDGFDEL